MYYTFSIDKSMKVNSYHRLLLKRLEGEIHVKNCNTLL